MSVDRVLHPLVDWLADRGQITFARHSATVLQLGDGLEPGEVMIVFQGTIPSQKGGTGVAGIGGGAAPGGLR